MEINDVLARMRTLEVAAKGNIPDQVAEPKKEVNFAHTLKKAINDVNETQAVSSNLSAQYAAGVESVDLPQVMVAMQESSIKFEAVKQVRNRVLSAYQEIMSMPV